MRIYKTNTAFTHKAQSDSDFVFQRNALIRNIVFSFELFTRQPPYPTGPTPTAHP